MRVLGLLIVLTLAGCVSIPQVHIVTPPEDLTSGCPDVFTPPIRTNGDLLSGYLAYRQAHQSCKDAEAALQEWAAGVNR